MANALNKKTVFLHIMKNLSTTKSFEKYFHSVTKVSFHPQGKLATSVDEKGIILIWYIDDCSNSKKLKEILLVKLMV